MALTEEQLVPRVAGGSDAEVPAIKKVLDQTSTTEPLKSTLQHNNSESLQVNGYYGSLAQNDPYYIPRGDQLAFTPRKIRVITVGAGFSGLLMAHKFQHRFPDMDAIVDHTIFEKRSEVGGTWIANTYPGVQCDVPSHIYVSVLERQGFLLRSGTGLRNNKQTDVQRDCRRFPSIPTQNGLGSIRAEPRSRNTLSKRPRSGIWTGIFSSTPGS